MARPSKLTPQQWQEIERRLSAGERAADLSREYGVSPAAVSIRVSKVSKQVSETAQILANAHNSLAALPVAQQYAAVSLADKLRSISGSLASAAELGAKTAHRLHALANAEVGRVDDAAPLSSQSLDSLRGVGVLTKLANDSSQLGVNLLSANRDRMHRADDAETPGAPAGVLVVPGVLDDAQWERMMHTGSGA